MAACVAIVFAAYLAWYEATSSFNPNPGTATLDTSSSCTPSAPPCPAFSIDSANLTVRKLSDITSQQLSIKITAVGPTQLSRVSVYFSGRPIGNITEVVIPGGSATDSWAIPTTMNVTVGDAYTVFVKGTYLASGGGASAEYWDSIQVTAVQ